MFRTQLKFFVRVFLKDKFFSILNILGLALGIAVSILLLLILQNDLSYDKYHVNHGRIYRLGGHLWATGIDAKMARSARELGNILKDELPEVQSVVRANSWDHTLVKYKPEHGEEKTFYEEDIVRADSTYFTVFTHEFIAGDPRTSLKEPHAVVLTESTVKKYFGDEDPINKTMIIGDESWKVTGVIKDVPENTHLKFDIMLSRLVDREWVMDQTSATAADGKGSIKSEAFWNPDVYTYLLVPEGYHAEDFNAKFVPIFNKYFKSFGDKVGGHYEPILEPLASIHFNSQLNADEPHGNRSYVYAFSGIGLFIILLACINYMNLSTAKSVGRAGEIAMKKTLGSGKRALILSFLGESVFLSVISMVVAVAMVALVLGSSGFNVLIGRNLKMDFVHNPLLICGTIGIAVLIGVVSGLYPAFYLPRIPTLQALKGAFKNQSSSLVLRKSLITVQFAISIFVVVCTLLMREQIIFVRNTDLGFNKENVLMIPIQDSVVQAQIGAIKTEFLRNPHVLAATTAYSVPGMGVGGPVMWAETDQGMKQQAFSLMNVAEDYFKTMDIKLIAGRNFQTGPNADVNDDAFIINEATAKLMGWKDPVGKRIKFFHQEKDGHVIGMVKNFNFTSLHNAVEPLILVKSRQEGGHLHLRVSGDRLPETIEMVRKKWAALDPGHLFEYFFLDQKFDEQYKSDEAQFKLLSILTGICIFISLLGLLGLSAFTAAQRTKEIGIRKVMGATVPQIVYLLFRDVMFLVVLSSVVVVPVAWYTMTGWLGNFAYKISITWVVFAVVTLLALLFTFLTVGFHSLRIARTNPVKSLKYE